jgi:hypothetical protein
VASTLPADPPLFSIFREIQIQIRGTRQMLRYTPRFHGQKLQKKIPTKKFPKKNSKKKFKQISKKNFQKKFPNFFFPKFYA